MPLLLLGSRVSLSDLPLTAEGYGYVTPSVAGSGTIVLSLLGAGRATPSVAGDGAVIA